MSSSAAESPQRSALQLQDVRERFLSLAFDADCDDEDGAYMRFEQEYSLLPQEFYEMIWEGFDFGQSPFIDLDLPVEKQSVNLHMMMAALTYLRPLDVQIYLFTLPQWPKISKTEPAAMQRQMDLFVSPSWRGWTKYHTERGIDFLRRMLKYKHG